jgi:hypothetical protein
MEDQVDAGIAVDRALKSAADALQAELSGKDWIETLVITASKRPAVDDAQDDLKREVALYAGCMGFVRK